MNKELRILILEDVPADAELEEYELRKAGLVFTLKIVDTREVFLKALEEFLPDIILSDYDLPSFDGLAALTIVKEKCPDVPFILVTGKVGEEFAIETLKKGVTDYVLKSNLKRLVPSIQRALGEAKLITERTRAEESLRINEEKYRSLVENQTELVCRFKPDGTFIFVNDVYCHYFGKTKDELIGKTWLPLPVDEDLTFIQEKLQTLSPTNPIVIIENRVVSSKGDIHWMQFVNRGFFDLQGNLQEIQSVGRDITEQKRAEKALKDSEKKYRLLFNGITDAVYIHEVSAEKPGKFVAVNDSACRMLGYTMEDFLQMEVEDIDMPEQSEKIPSIQEKLYKTGYALFETCHVAKDGRRIPVEINIQLVELHGKSMVLSVARDITERKLAEEQVKRLHESIGLAMEASKSGTWDWDITNNTFIWSSEFLKLFGMHPDTVAGFETWRNSLHPEDREIAAKRIQDSINDKTELTNDYRIILPNQEIHWIRAIGRTFYDKDTPMRMTGICIDITELKRLERELKDKIESLEYWNKMFFDREQKMIELKKEVNLLLEQLGQTKKYMW